MKKVILLALFMPYMAYGQIIENFESGDLNNWIQSTENRWKADPESSVSGIFSLHHIFDNPDAGTDRIGIQVKNLHLSEGSTQWSFRLRHGYDPSSSNNWAVFLMSDSDPVSMSLDGVTSGYAIGVNLFGYDDSLRLIKIKGNAQTTVVNCRINWQTTLGIAEPAEINVQRTADGDWTVSVYKKDGSLVETTTGTDNEIFSPVWMTVWYKYSSTRDRLLWIDDICVEGVFYEDTVAPYIDECKPLGKKSVRITLSEVPVEDFISPDNFSLNSTDNTAISVIKVSPLIYNVEFDNELINRSLNYISINEICDKSGNCTADLKVLFTPVWAEAGDVIISEIMADPLPEVSLPGREYIEITNRTNDSFNLENWRFTSGGQNYLFPESIIGPNEILIICLQSDVPEFSKFGKVLGLKQFPVLTDGGKLICLNDSTKALIHGLEYSSEWYGDELKASGGWSLEIIDTDNPFFDKGNWKASSSRKGGTPGTLNSVNRSNPDRLFTGLLNVFPNDSNNIRISFSEPVLTLSRNISYIKIDGVGIADHMPDDPLFRKYTIKPVSPLEPGKIYHLDISEDITDFAGNISEKKGYDFGIAVPASDGDILFNELLFNPFPGDADYIEFSNVSDKIINTERLLVVSVNEATGDTSQLYPVSYEARCILPGSYYAITINKEHVAERYYSSYSDALHEISGLPSMNDDKGQLILFNRELEKIDEVFYNEKMHYSLLSDYEGIALEKTAPQLKSDEALNWHSAAESCGWGTPGAPNSLYVEQPATSDRVTFSSSKITPDNDGFEDFLTISFNLSGNSNVLSVTIFDETGNFVKKISSNLFAAPETSLIWDGTADDGTAARTGIYIIFITLYDDTGKTAKWKKVCTVIR